MPKRLYWYKADPQAFIRSTVGMRFEVKAAFRLVVDLIYFHDGALPDDDKYIAGQIGADVRVWRRLKKELVDEQRVYLDAGAIRNRRCDAEIVKAVAKLEQTVTSGVASGLKRRKSSTKTAENKDLTGTDVPEKTNDIRDRVREDSSVVRANALTPEAGKPAVEQPDGWNKRVWEEGVALLGERNRSLVGKARKAFRNDDLKLWKVLQSLRVLVETEDVFDPVTWFLGAVAKENDAVARCGTSAALAYIMDPVTGSIPG